MDNQPRQSLGGCRTWTLPDTHYSSTYRLGCTTYIELNTRAYRVGLGYAATDGACDIVIAAIMCWLLHSNRTEHRRCVPVRDAPPPHI
jgi:hypothetical protein